MLASSSGSELGALRGRARPEGWLAGGASLNAKDVRVRRRPPPEGTVRLRWWGALMLSSAASRRFMSSRRCQRRVNSFSGAGNAPSPAIRARPSCQSDPCGPLMVRKPSARPRRNTGQPKRQTRPAPASNSRVNDRLKATSDSAVQTAPAFAGSAPPPWDIMTVSGGIFDAPGRAPRLW